MIIADKEKLAAFARGKLGANEMLWSDGKFSAIGIEDNDSGIRVAVIYDQHFSPNICAHIASDGSKRWATKKFLRLIFSYPFLQLGVGRITAPVKSSNKSARAFLEKAGFKLEGVIRHINKDGSDRLLYGMLANECRWIAR